MARMTDKELAQMETDLAARMNGTAEYDSVEQHDFLVRAVIRLLADAREARRIEAQPRPRSWREAA